MKCLSYNAHDAHSQRFESSTTCLSMFAIKKQTFPNDPFDLYICSEIIGYMKFVENVFFYLNLFDSFGSSSLVVFGDFQ